MAKAQTAAAARFVTEVAPPPMVSVMRREKKKKVPRSLDTIAEDDSEHLAVPAYYGPSSSDHQGFAAAWSSRRAPAREHAGGFVSELSIRCFSDAHGQQAAPAAGRVAITS
ncbi:unnamed protein product [Urochloa decumbens]|uniref:Uncharacterized protein n=1 Tax=Urochloa decumbens TaxID=240449 RepID=A0ABC9CPG2_9POAL